MMRLRFELTSTAARVCSSVALAAATTLLTTCAEKPPTEPAPRPGAHLPGLAVGSENLPGARSHYRGGFVSATINANGVVTVSAETRWRKGGVPDSTFPLGGITRVGLVGGVFPTHFQILDASTRAVLKTSETDPALAISVVGTTVSTDLSNPDFDVRRQQFNVDLPALGLGQGTYILYWTDAGRLDGINNVTACPNFGGPPFGPIPVCGFSLEARIIFDGTARSTPSVGSHIDHKVPKGLTYSANLDASGPSVLTYGFLVGNFAPRWGPSFNIPGITVSATGQVEIPAASTATLNHQNLIGEPGADYIFKIQITDADGQYIEEDALLDVVAGKITVTVQNPPSPVPNRVVTVVNNVVGPFRGDGTATLALTDLNGMAVLGDLLLGNYCAHVRPLTSVASATGAGDFVVPDDSEPTQAEDEAGAITGASPTSVAFTNANYVQFCVQTPPISLDVNNSQANVTLQLQAGVSVEVQVTDLNGETQALPAWAVMDKTGEIPWCPAELIALGVNCGILLSTTPNSGATLTGLPPASPVAVEILGEIDEEQGFLAFSIPEVTTPQAGDPPLPLQVQAEPLMCTLERKNEPQGDGAPGKIDFLGPVKDGLRGDPGVPITPLNEIAIFYDQTGNGNAKLIMRFARRAGRVLELMAPYECTDGDCEAGSASGSALGAGISVESERERRCSSGDLVGGLRRLGD